MGYDHYDMDNVDVHYDIPCTMNLGHYDIDNVVNWSCVMEYAAFPLLSFLILLPRNYGINIYRIFKVSKTALDFRDI